MGTWRNFLAVFCLLFAVGFIGIARHGWKLAQQVHPPMRWLAKAVVSVPKPATAESDADALSEEELDRLEMERQSLLKRRQALEQMINESRRLVLLKEKRIEELQKLLQQSQ